LHTVDAATRVYRDVLERWRMPAARTDLRWSAEESGARRVDDPARGTSYRVGEKEAFLLRCCDGRESRDDVRRAFRERFGADLSPAELEDFIATARTGRRFVEEPTP